MIFAILAVVLVVSALAHPRAQQDPMLRTGGTIIGVALGLIALVFLIGAL